ncbi:hypothetical protein CsSME_00023812 [Camellia sinensis var. sinensis]|uniref:Uncharacterized protein n=2 Tax=Camellia sinensis TaxID=4442 RepID=A0A7J7H3E8_CAMSI|nr:hypothetical protein HYC85_016444 [Camellia sinensis]THF93967.1 hypothetical protein TEA_028440 [Camellia sinensis var. sinensis]
MILSPRQAIHLGGEIFGIVSTKKFEYNSINTARDVSLDVHTGESNQSSVILMNSAVDNSFDSQMTNILIDGAWKRSLGGKAAAAWIAFLDEELQIIICHAQQLYLPSLLAAETSLRGGN